MVLLLPVFLVIMLLIRIESKGPVLFKQTRVGLNGHEFTMYKFRSMHLNAETQLNKVAHLNEIKDGPIFKITNDPRLTKVGRILRKYSLDEFPQLINVLKGEMSLVGPRPPLPREVIRYAPSDLVRLTIKPGMSGLWQVTPTKGSFKEMLELDKRYIEQWSMNLDAWIVFKTLGVVLNGLSR